MKIEIHINEAAAARAAATALANEIRSAVNERGRCVLAVSGGRTPWVMYRALAKQDVPWQDLQIVQVDERVTPTGDPERNLTHLRESLTKAPLRPERVHTMDVEATDFQSAANQYAATLREIAGNPPVIDIIHLGLGPDGHTASLVPGDRVLDVTDVDVAMTGGAYQGRLRMTLTYPAINRARRILWVVTGQEKASALARMRDSDPYIPAGRVNHDHAIVIADRPAASKLEKH